MLLLTWWPRSSSMILFLCSINQESSSGIMALPKLQFKIDTTLLLFKSMFGLKIKVEMEKQGERIIYLPTV